MKSIIARALVLISLALMAGACGDETTSTTSTGNFTLKGSGEASS